MASKGSKDFFKKLNSYPGLVLAQALTLQKIIALDALAQFIDITAEDTSRAKGNWKTSTGSQHDKGYEWERYDNRDSALEKGSSEIASMNEPGIVHISNNIPYGYSILEQGHSKQVSQGALSMTMNNIATKYGFS